MSRTSHARLLAAAVVAAAAVGCSSGEDKTPKLSGDAATKYAGSTPEGRGTGGGANTQKGGVEKK